MLYVVGVMYDHDSDEFFTESEKEFNIAKKQILLQMNEDYIGFVIGGEEVYIRTEKICRISFYINDAYKNEEEHEDDDTSYIGSKEYIEKIESKL